jgi:hypothetical protein
MAAVDQPAGGARKDRRESAPRHVHDLLLASIEDVQGSIVANDTKASAALIVHGLLFTGVITLLVNLNGVYRPANHVQKYAALAFLCVTFAAFLVSIYFLLGALLPYHPKELEDQLREKYSDKYREVFFPLGLLECADPYGALLNRTNDLDDDSITAELAAERIKLADILRHESTQTQRGYLWLRAEIAFASLFLIVVVTAVL